MSNNNEFLLTREDFILPGDINNDFSNEELEEDSFGIQVSFPRIKIPSGGQLVYEMPESTAENPIYEAKITGIILYNHAHNAYWSDSDNDENTPPDCFSIDGIYGLGDPGGECPNCHCNQWGTGAKGKGKACKNMRVLYVLRSGDFMPIQFTLPPTSIRPFGEFYNKEFKLRRRASFGSVVEIGLKRIDGDNDYSIATFKRLFDFDGEQLANIKSFTKSFKNNIKILNQERATEVPDIPYAADWNGSSLGDDEFEITNSAENIDGDRSQLPE